MSNQAKVDEITQDLDFAAKKYRVDFVKTAGPISLNLNIDLAPGHCRKLIGLARLGFYFNF
ncbi:MAG: hypothetical protein VYE53_15890 [Planctomycetota bacterium]|nr:hypothetical protein [Planctomycetota bacterium]